MAYAKGEHNYGKRHTHATTCHHQVRYHPGKNEYYLVPRFKKGGGGGGGGNSGPVRSQQLSMLQDTTTTSTFAIVNVYYNDTVDTYGWGALKISKSSNSFAASSSAKSGGNKGTWTKDTVVPGSLEQVYYAAGYAEGRLTQLRLWQNWVNTMNPANKSKIFGDNMTRWVNRNLDWIRSQIALRAATEPYWASVSRIMALLEGLVDGYQEAAPQQQYLSYFDLYMFQLQAEMGDIIAVSKDYDSGDLNKSRKKGGCSAFIRPTIDDIFVAHATWDGYNAMLRMFKDYDFGVTRVAFSSYPGFLQSSDDWYQMSTGLISTETTNNLYDTSLYMFTIPEASPEWIRVMVANELAIDGESWHNIFCRYNSGTYDNQYMVVNTNIFVPGTPLASLPQGLVWISEQFPGMCPMGDVTDVVRKQGYWGSYNTPYFPLPYNASGTEQMKLKYNAPWFFGYHQYSRAKIFARDAPKVQTLNDAKRLIRYNQWKTDPLSECPGCNPKSNPTLSVAARADLIPANGTWSTLQDWLSGPALWGEVDAKIGSYKMLKASFTAVIINGPTYDSLPPFQWSTCHINASIYSSSHVGIPDRMMFPWVTMEQLFNGSP